MESPVANNVTSQPRATRPSVILLATVSHAPYCRGGVRQATGDSTAILLLGMIMASTHGCQYSVERCGSEAGGMICQAVWDDQVAFVEESTTGINNVRHIAFALILIGL